VTLTGSEGAGASVASTAGKAIKKSVLELGGSDPFVVMPSANVEAAVKTAVTARTINNGQSCIAAKRFIVHEAVYDGFVKAFVQRMSDLVVGDPTDPGTDVGPLSSSGERDKLVEQVRAIKEAGGRVVLGGAPRAGRGFYYPPTVIVNVPLGTAASREEVFGPVAMVFRVKDADGAIQVANDVPFGLGSSVWTNDAAERARFIDELEAGATFVNAMVASDPRLPFGGVKRSGYGRELALHGIREFVNAKAVSIAEVPAEKQAATE
jgi:succinate-semialdehyde dehydrogenase / glutarate-semialdehyde dehydrogenase